MVSRKIKRKNVLLQLQNREYHAGLQYRNNIAILKKLVCEGDYTYKKVWEKYSSRPILCEGCHAYFENYVHCYGGYGMGLKPRHMYSLFVPHNRKINDSLMGNVPVESITHPFKHKQASLYCIVGKAWLVQYNWLTGKLTYEVYISNRFRFSNISWNEPNKSIVVKSVHNVTAVRQAPMNAGVRVVKVLVLFDVPPLQFKAMLEISKKIFGRDLVDATVSQGFLITMHYSGFVKFFSLDFILNEFQHVDTDWSGKVDSDGIPLGCFPSGLPNNVLITYQPPVLFEVKCDQHSVEVGGFPWHYLCSPQGKQGTFHVRSLTNNVLAEHGNLRMDTLNYEPDRACFFGDESGRILHIGPTEFRMFSIKEGKKMKADVQLNFTINMERKDKILETSHPLYTSSGRRIQRSVSQDELMDCPNFTIYNVDYEDELDVLWTSAVYHNENGPAGIVGFHDNLTGKLLKEIEIEEPFDEMYEHRIIVDLDTIIQVVKSGQGKFVCVFYRLQGNVKEDSEKSDTKCDSSEGSRRGQRSRRRSSRSRSRSQSVDRTEIRGSGRRIMNVDIE